jgi:hypothetical protein
MVLGVSSFGDESVCDLIRQAITVQNRVCDSGSILLWALDLPIGTLPNRFHIHRNQEGLSDSSHSLVTHFAVAPVTHVVVVCKVEPDRGILSVHFFCDRRLPPLGLLTVALSFSLSGNPRTRSRNSFSSGRRDSVC